MKFNPTGFAVAVLTFALSMMLVYTVHGVVPTVFDGFNEEEVYHCSQ